MDTCEFPNVGAFAEEKWNALALLMPDGTSHLLTKDKPTTIGLLPDNEIVISNDIHISRHHARIWFDSNHNWIIEDLKSTNGTRINNVDVGKAVLHPECIIKLGETEIDVKAGQHKSGLPGFVAVDPAMSMVVRKAREAAKQDSHVLITGELGTGKTLLANLIHKLSSRGQKDIGVYLDNGLGDKWVDYDLLGHKAGAFKGARDRAGLLRYNEGRSVLFKGTLSPRVQKNLLEVLRTGRVKPVGDSAIYPVDVRIIATGDDSNWMQQDLYRCFSTHIELPPLRERKEDIPLLAKRLAFKRGLPLLPERVFMALAGYSWPNNIWDLSELITRDSKKLFEMNPDELNSYLQLIEKGR